MKKLLLLAIVALSSCENSEDKIQNLPTKAFSLNIENGHGWSWGVSTIDCDSFQMQGTKKAFIWADGRKMTIEAEGVIYPHSNR